jgi:tetraacyldisaccharide 4'-kinase
MASGGMAARIEALLARHWWRASPSALVRLLTPLAWLYAALLRLAKAGQPAPVALPVPVLVVGNFVVGGAGKTPAVVALVQALQAAGHHPGVISRGYGRTGDGLCEVTATSTAPEVGDEPLLVQRRCTVPVWVGRARAQAARALLARHPQVDVIVSDDGLQHARLPRQAAVVVFDERGIGNGLLLPAGPLREALPRRWPPQLRVLYTGGRPSTPLPGHLAHRMLRDAWPLRAWLAGDAAAAVPMAQLRGKPLLAAAGIAAPEKFFGMLEAAGLAIARLPLPDHHDYTNLPWPADTPDVLVTEKDAVKLGGHDVGATRVWVLPLDLQIPGALVAELSALLFPHHPP